MGLKERMRQHPYVTAWVFIGLLFAPILVLPREDGALTWPWAIFAFPGLIALFLSPLIMGVVWLFQNEAKQKAKRQTLARAEYEHWALMHGYDGAGTYGQYTPAQM